ncbi:hypothetical protein [Aquimarina aggregata]|uniref:hypothetical protein n=1 Tax=Aquimarina aggregata TaxID=1642818 RepID=UPI000837A061|nr:hypothetical protein [Aquimarina aggregata]
MKKTTLFILFFLCISGTYCQSKLYTLNLTYPDEVLSEFEYTPVLYEVHKKDLTNVFIEKSMNKNNVYNSLQKKILNLKEESITIRNAYEKALIKHKKTNLISAYIKIFENSNAPIDIRKEELIKAQKIADNYNIDIFVYADDNTVPDKKNGLDIIKNNPLHFNNYLKNEVLSITKNNPKPKPYHKTIDQRINMLRNKAKMIKKNKTIALLKDRIENEKSFLLGDRANYNNLSGVFEKIGNYQVISNDYGPFFKNELIQDSIIKKFNIPKNHIVFQETTTLIIHSKSKKYYLVAHDLLKKVNHTPYLEQVVYTNKIKNNNTVNQTNTIEYSLKEYESMITECKKLTMKLIAHKEIAQKGNMTKTQFKNWKKDLVEAKLLNYRIYEFTSAYKHFNYPLSKYVNKEVLNNYNYFSEILTNSSKHVAL